MPSAVSPGIPPRVEREQKAQDAQAKTLLRNASTALETQFISTGTFDPAYATPSILQAVEPRITYIPGEFPRGEGSFTIGASAEDDAVTYSGDKSSYMVGTNSESGRVFYVLEEKTGDEGPSSPWEPRYFQVDQDGITQEGW